MWWFQSPKIAFGEDALEVLKNLEGKKAFIVTDKVIRSLDFVNIVSEYLKQAEMDVRVYDGVKPEPSIENIQEGSKLLMEFTPDARARTSNQMVFELLINMWFLVLGISLVVYLWPRITFF